MPENLSKPVQSLSERLIQVVKVEEPVSFEAIRNWCRDVPIREVDQTLLQMVAAGWLRVKREWAGNQLLEIYSYADQS